MDGLKCFGPWYEFKVFDGADSMLASCNPMNGWFAYPTVDDTCGSGSAFLPSGGYLQHIIQPGDCGPYQLYVWKEDELIEYYTSINSEWIVRYYAQPGEYRFYYTEAGGQYFHCTDLVLNADPNEPVTHHLGLRVLLEGAYLDASTPWMRTDLIGLPDFPVTEPYSAMGWTAPGAGGESMVAVPAGTLMYIVDWIQVIASTEEEPDVPIAAQNIALRRGGQGNPRFVLPFGSYYFTIRHRNHLAVRTGPYMLTGLHMDIDLVSPEALIHGPDTRAEVPPNRMALRAGNAQLDEGLQKVSYLGANNDRDAVLLKVGGLPTGTVSGYHQEDLNLDGVVKYTGANNDRDVILQAIGGSTPTAVVFEQLP